jgi:hypothetical protein
MVDNCQSTYTISLSVVRRISEFFVTHFHFFHELDLNNYLFPVFAELFVTVVNSEMIICAFRLIQAYLMSVPFEYFKTVLMDYTCTETIEIFTLIGFVDLFSF